MMIMTFFCDRKLIFLPQFSSELKTSCAERDQFPNSVSHVGLYFVAKECTFKLIEYFFDNKLQICEKKLL